MDEEKWETLGKGRGESEFPSHTPSLLMESDIKEQLPCPQHRGSGYSKSSRKNGAGAGKMAGNSRRGHTRAAPRESWAGVAAEQGNVGSLGWAG